MKEKTFRTITGSGATALVAGIITIAVGVSCGVLMIISGAKLLAARHDVLD